MKQYSRLFTSLFITCFTLLTHVQGMQDVLLTTLRDAQTTRAQFRKASDSISRLLAARVAEQVTTAAQAVETQLGTAQGAQLIDDIILVPVMRSGNVMLQSFLNIFEDAKVGFIMIQRDEETALPQFYYEKMPPLKQNTKIVILEPMLATGGSINAVIKRLHAMGITNDRIVVCTVICATEGLQRILGSFPGVTVLYAAQDSELNAAKFIVPGLGDYGDRYYGTE